MGSGEVETCHGVHLILTGLSDTFEASISAALRGDPTHREGSHWQLMGNPFSHLTETVLI